MELHKERKSTIKRGRNMASKKVNVNLIKQELDLYMANPSLVMAQKKWTRKQYNDYIKSLQDKIEQSKRGKSSKRKGSNYERKVARMYKESLNVNLVRTPMSGGFQKNVKATNIKGDLSCLDENIDFLLHTECKDQKTVKIRNWFEQACEDCPSKHIPTVVMHLIQQIKNGKVVSESEDLIVLRVKDFLRIVDHDKIIKPKKVRRLKR